MRISKQASVILAFLVSLFAIAASDSLAMNNGDSVGSSDAFATADSQLAKNAVLHICFWNLYRIQVVHNESLASMKGKESVHPSDPISANSRLYIIVHTAEDRAKFLIVTGL